MYECTVMHINTPHSQQNIRTETDLNFAIKMPNVADDGVVLHEGEVLPSNDVLAA